MKQKLLTKAFFVFAIVVNTSTFSQEYHPLLNNSSWLLRGSGPCCAPTDKILEEGTAEVIDSKTYKKLIDPFSNNVIYLREDISEKKVYKLVDGKEELLYDFNLENSDIILHEGYTFTATVDSIKVIQGTRKRITLKSAEELCGQPRTQVWIEGVGSIANPLIPGCNMTVDACHPSAGYHYATLCSFQNGIHVYGISDSCSPLLPVKDLNSQAEQIQLLPNPASDIVQVLQKGTDILDSITVYDMLGKIVQKVNGIAAPQSAISVASLSKGIYLMEIITQSKIKTTRKLIVK